MTQAVRKVCHDARSRILQPDDVTEEMLEGQLYTSLSGLGLKPDLVPIL
jgi:undecaprenyl pyrophosphate synthase